MEQQTAETRREGKETYKLSKTGNVLTVISVVFCVVTVILTVIIMVSEDTYKETPVTVCVSCSLLSERNLNKQQLDPLFENIVKKMDDGIHKCCAENQEQILALIEMASRRKHMQRVQTPENHTFIRFSPASAHKHLLPSASSINLKEPVFNDELVVPIIDAWYDNPLTEHVRGVKIMNDSLMILYSGLYYIYSSVHFRPVSNRPGREFKYKSWFHYVHRLTGNDPANSGTLLQSAHTVCDDCTANEETVFIGGAFYLGAGDQIQVCYSSLGVVKFDHESTFVGLVMLASG